MKKKRMLLNKRGSQVEVVISFVIFMIFIFFVYLLAQPSLKLEKKKSSLEHLESALAEKAVENLTAVSVSISSSQDCVELTDFFSTTESGNKIITRSDADSVLLSGISGQSLFVQRNGVSFFRVYESDEFPVESGTMSGCQALTQGNNYALGLIKTSRSIFETKIIKMIDSYNADYDLLKDELKIPSENDFDFSFTYNNGTEILTKNQGQVPTSNINIYSRSIPIVYTSKNAGTESGLLNIKMW